MKSHILLPIMILAILISGWATFAQPRSNRATTDRGRDRESFMVFQLLTPEEAAELREKWPNMSEQERSEFRAQLRQKWDKLSDEEKEKLRSQARERMSVGRRGALSTDEQLNAVKSIENQLAKLKENIQNSPQMDGRSFRDLSEDERVKLTQQITKNHQDREQALQAITAQIAMLQELRTPQTSADDAEYIIVNVGDLRQIQNLAEQEKATDTAQRLELLISRASGPDAIGRIRPGAADRPRDRVRPPRPRRDSENQTDSENSGR